MASSYVRTKGIRPGIFVHLAATDLIVYHRVLARA
jgi:hypothetical protein